MTAAVFLPGILMPGHLRYGALLAALGSPQDAVVKELEVYAAEGPPGDDLLAAEVRGLDRFVAAHGMGRFHLYGYSFGATVALAYVAVHGEKVLSLALDEPASDFSDQDRRLLAAETPDLDQLPQDQRVAAFARSVVRPGVTVPPAPPLPPEQLAGVSAALTAAGRALRDHRVDQPRLRTYRGPVLVSHGSQSSARWQTMAARLAQTFPDCTVQRYEGAHHLHTGHQTQPDRVAATLRKLWDRAHSPVAAAREPLSR